MFNIVATFNKVIWVLSRFYVLDIRTFRKTYIRLNFVTKSGMLFGYQSRHMSGLSIDLLENIHLLTHLWFNLIQRSFLYFSGSRYYCLVCYPKLYTFLWLGSTRIGWFSSHVSSHPSQMTNKWHTIRSQQMEKLTRTDVGWPVNSGRILAIGRCRLAHEWWGVFDRRVAHQPWKWGLNIMCGIEPQILRGVVLLAPFSSVETLLDDYYIMGPLLAPLRIFPFLSCESLLLPLCFGFHAFGGKSDSHVQ